MRLFNNKGNSSAAPPSGLHSIFNEDNPPPDSAAFVPYSSHSTRSGDSSDSGCDPGEDYSFVITENSPQELVKKVEREFKTVDNLSEFALSLDD